MQFSLKLRLPAFACAASFLLCELISRPWAEAGISDDWSYIRTSQLLAHTGHIHYVGWSTAIQGWQLYLAATCIKLFGFSFTAARLPTFLIALITAYVMQRTLVRFGISEGNAVLGTLTFVLSPLFMQLSATMMTDVPGFFSILACIYACVRALQAIRDRDAILWLCFAVAVNAICGTSRQIAWLGVLVLVPSTLFLLRSRKNVLFYGLLATALGYLFVFVTLYWFNMQPYTQLEPLALVPFQLWALRRLGNQYLRSLILMGLLLFPLEIPFIAALRRFSLRHFFGLAALTSIFVVVACCIRGTTNLRPLLNPFTRNWVGMHAMYDGPMLRTTPPTVLSFPVVHGLSLIAILGILCVAAAVLIARPIVISPPPLLSLSWSHLAVLFVPLTFAYLLLLSHRGGVQSIFDRYLLTPLFLAMVCILLYSQQHLKVRWPIAIYLAIGAIAFYGICSTHNTFALARARVILAKEVFDAGVPCSHIDLGEEMNGWCELQLSTHVNDARILRPTGAYHLYPEPHWSGCHPLSTFGFLPHIAPRYGIAFEPNVCDGPAPFASVNYSTWPLSQPTTLYIVKYPPPWQSAIDVENHTP